MFVPTYSLLHSNTITPPLIHTPPFYHPRYLERKIRDALDFEGTPLKLIFRGKTIRDVGRAVKKGTDTLLLINNHTITSNLLNPHQS